MACRAKTLDGIDKQGVLEVAANRGFRASLVA